MAISGIVEWGYKNVSSIFPWISDDFKKRMEWSGIDVVNIELKEAQSNWNFERAAYLRWILRIKTAQWWVKVDTNKVLNS